MDELRARLARRGHIILGLLLFDGYEPLDVYGPLQLLSAAAPTLPGHRGCIQTVVLSATASRRAKPAYGPDTLADRTINEAQSADGAVDLLLVPGGWGARQLQHNTSFVAKLRRLAAWAAVIATVCTGSLLLARTGLLDGRTATTNKAAFYFVADARPTVLWQRSARWCSDGPFYTASGVSAGADLGYAMLVGLLGEKAAYDSAVLAEYIPNTDPARDHFAVEDGVGESSAESSLVNPFGRPLKLMAVLFDQFEMLEAFGPIEMFGLAGALLGDVGQPEAFDIRCVAEQKEVHSAQGPTFVADLTFAELAAREDSELSFDLLFVPAGIGSLPQASSAKTLSLLSRLAASSVRVMTVSAGSAFLAAAGVLDGLRASSSTKLAFHLLAGYGPRVRWVPKAQWLADGKFYTSSGASAGTDLSLHLLHELFGQTVAEVTAQRAEYEWAESNETVAALAQSAPSGTLKSHAPSALEPLSSSSFSLRSSKGVEGSLLRITVCLGLSLGLQAKVTSRRS